VDHLHVEVWGTREIKLQLVQQAVEAIAGVRAARESGRLEIVSTMQKEGPFGFPGQTKRMLVDRRFPSD
jgi:hypothetical protein